MVTSGNPMTMSAKTTLIPASEFKAKRLALFDDVETRGRSFVVTKRGRPVARVVPLHAEKLSSLRGNLLHEEGILEPVDVRWDVTT